MPRRTVLHALASNLVALALCAAGFASSPALPLASEVSAVRSDPAIEGALLDTTNLARTRNGLPPVQVDEGLARAARAHAEEMARLDYFSHGSPVAANEDLRARLARHGSPLVSVAENLARLGRPGTTEQAASRAVEGWLASPGHRANLLRPEYDRVGFGTATAADGGLLVVQDLGAEPVALLSETVVASSRTVTEVRLRVWADQAVEAAFTLAGAPAPSTHLPAGSSELTLTTGADRSIQLLAGIGLGDHRFVVADAGWIDPVANTFRPDPTVSRQHLRIESATVARRSDRGARLTLRYLPPIRGKLALFLDGVHQPTALSAPGVFELYLPRDLGAVTVGVGVSMGGEAVRMVHRFHVDARLPFPALHAGPLPDVP